MGRPSYLRHSGLPIRNCPGGGDVPKLEPRRLNFRRVDKIVRDLRRIYKENPALFDIPTFAQKQTVLTTCSTSLSESFEPASRVDAPVEAIRVARRNSASRSSEMPICFLLRLTFV